MEIAETQVTTKSFHDTSDATGFKDKGRPSPLGVHGATADGNNGADGAA